MRKYGKEAAGEPAIDMNRVKMMKLTKKKCVIMSIAGVLVLSLVIGSILMITQSGNSSETEMGNQPTRAGNISIGDMVTSTGYAVYETKDQELDVTIDSKDMTNYLTVEEVKVSAGDTVQEGDVLFTVTKDSFDAAKSYLTQQVTTAETALAKEELDYKQAVLDAEYDRLNDSQLGESAKVEYENSVSQLQSQVNNAKDSYQEAVDAIEDNPSDIATNKKSITSYQAKLKTIEASLKTAEVNSTKTLTAYENAVSEYKTVLYTYKYLLQLENKSTSEVDKLIASVEQTSLGNGGSTGGNSTPGGTASEGAPSDSNKQPSGNDSMGAGPSINEKSSVEAANAQNGAPGENGGNVTQGGEQANNSVTALLTTVKSKCSTYAKTYASTKSAYDAAATKVTTLTATKNTYTSKISTLEQKNTQLQTAYDQAKSNLSSLQSKYTELLTQQQQQLITLKKTYDLNVLTSESAQSTYDTTIASLQEELQTYKDALTEAKENLTNLTSSITDCQYIAKESGTIAAVNYVNGDTISNGLAPVSYINSSLATITVAIGQEDISKIDVLDSVTIMDSSTRGRYSGTIQEIGAIASSDSVTNVTYDVIIQVPLEEGTTISTSNSLSITFGEIAMNIQGGNKQFNQDSEGTTSEDNADSIQEGAQNEK